MKNNKFAVETKFFDNGFIEIGNIETVGFEQESKFESREKYDYYYDVFLTKEEAEIRRQACIEEKYGERAPIKHAN